MKILDTHIKQLEKEYDVLNDEMARGETLQYNAQPLTQHSTTHRFIKHIYDLDFSVLRNNSWFQLRNPRWCEGAHKKMNASTYVPWAYVFESFTGSTTIFSKP